MLIVFMIHEMSLFTLLTIRKYLQKAGCQQPQTNWTVQKMPNKPAGCLEMWHFGVDGKKILTTIIGIS